MQCYRKDYFFQSWVTGEVTRGSITFQCRSPADHQAVLQALAVHEQPMLADAARLSLALVYERLVEIPAEDRLAAASNN